MKLEEFNYLLPKELIAQQPLEQRDQSRMMVLNRNKGSIEHSFFYCLPEYLKKGDLLVANDTRVIPARIFGKKKTGGWVELFLLDFIENETENAQIWECLFKTKGKIEAGSNISFSINLNADLLENLGKGMWKVRLNYKGTLENALEETGKIKRSVSPSPGLIVFSGSVMVSRTLAAVVPTDITLCFSP